MTTLADELNIAKAKREARTEEEQKFYEDIIGKSSFVREMKQDDKYWKFTREYDINLLLEQMANLNTQNPEIISVMKFLTKDYKDRLYNKEGREIGDKFQERLVLLGIEEKKKKGFFGR
jgi:hypothetical protein